MSVAAVLLTVLRQQLQRCTTRPSFPCCSDRRKKKNHTVRVFAWLVGSLCQEKKTGFNNGRKTGRQAGRQADREWQARDPRDPNRPREPLGFLRRGSCRSSKKRGRRFPQIHSSLLIAPRLVKLDPVSPRILRRPNRQTLRRRRRRRRRLCCRSRLPSRTSTTLLAPNHLLDLPLPLPLPLRRRRHRPRSPCFCCCVRLSLPSSWSVRACRRLCGGGKTGPSARHRTGPTKR